MTDHAPRNNNRNRLWIGFTILVVCAAVVIGWRFVQTRDPIVTVTKPVVEDSKTTTGDEARSVEASPANSSEPRAIPRTDAAAEKSPAAAIAPRATAVITPRDTSRDQPILTTSQVSLPDDEEAVDEEVLPDHPLIDMPGNWPQPIKAAVAPDVAKIQPVSFTEAISKMTLSLLIYNDNKAERMVYINGKKYAEGDYIEGIYLLESITGDGAIISHQGERTLLQPKPK
jgi:hypothetical protein